VSATYEVPDTRGFEGDITVLLTSIAKLLGTARWSSVLPSIVDAAECDADLAEFKSATRALSTKLSPARGVEANTQNCDPKTIAIFLGFLFYRR
jgi:hypothetical protein